MLRTQSSRALASVNLQSYWPAIPNVARWWDDFSPASHLRRPLSQKTGLQRPKVGEQEVAGWHNRPYLELLPTGSDWQRLTSSSIVAPQRCWACRVWMAGCGEGRRLPSGPGPKPTLVGRRASHTRVQVLVSCGHRFLPWPPVTPGNDHHVPPGCAIRCITVYPFWGYSGVGSSDRHPLRHARTHRRGPRNDSSETVYQLRCGGSSSAGAERSDEERGTRTDRS